VTVHPAGRGSLGTAVQVVLLLLLLSILAGVLIMLFAIASLLTVPNQVAGSVGNGLSGVASEAGRAVSGAQQAVQNVTDPNRPPVGLTYDNEFTSLHVLHVGEQLPGGTRYGLAVSSIGRRPGTDPPDTAIFAVVHAELRQPVELRFLGQLLRTDRDPRDHVLYKGETFRVGRALYRVNWISQEENALAIGVFRRPDTVNSRLTFDYD
jgi:hypothetical protein